MEVLLVLIVLAVGLFIGLKFLKNFTGGTKSIINSRKKKTLNASFFIL